MNLNSKPKPELNVNLNINELPFVECDNCGNTTFKMSFKIKRVSPLISGEPREKFIPIEVFICEKCGHLNKNLNPFALLEELNEESI